MGLLEEGTSKNKRGAQKLKRYVENLSHIAPLHLLLQVPFTNFPCVLFDPYAFTDFYALSLTLLCALTDSQRLSLTLVRPRCPSLLSLTFMRSRWLAFALTNSHALYLTLMRSQSPMRFHWLSCASIDSYSLSLASMRLLWILCAISNSYAPSLTLMWTHYVNIHWVINKIVFFTLMLFCWLSYALVSSFRSNWLTCALGWLSCALTDCHTLLLTLTRTHWLLCPLSIVSINGL